MMHPELLQSLARSHAADLRADASRHPARRRTPVRMAAGWVLIELGLRLAVEKPTVVATSR